MVRAHPHIRGKLATKSPEWLAWRNMRYRCQRQTDRGFARYGGRGIRVCKRWESFDLFFADMGLRPGKGYSLDRVDNNGDYEPGNCRWATAAEQATNRSNNVRIVLAGARLCLSELARLAGRNAALISRRKKNGLQGAALLAPPRAGFLYDFRGRKATLREICQELGVPKVTIEWRLKAGWELERAITEPPRPKRKY